jgi:hypothetical protein
LRLAILNYLDLFDKKKLIGGALLQSFYLQQVKMTKPLKLKKLFITSYFFLSTDSFKVNEQQIYLL